MKWAAIWGLEGLETIRHSSTQAGPSASSTTYWMTGRSSTGSISLGVTFVAGRKRVPRPAAGMTDFMFDPSLLILKVRLELYKNLFIH